MQMKIVAFAINFCYADENCRLRVKFHDKKQEDIFFLNAWSCVISLIAKFKYTLFYQLVFTQFLLLLWLLKTSKNHTFFYVFRENVGTTLAANEFSCVPRLPCVLKYSYNFYKIESYLNWYLLMRNTYYEVCLSNEDINEEYLLWSMFKQWIHQYQVVFGVFFDKFGHIFFTLFWYYFVWGS